MTPLIRAEGIAELVGDIRLICESSLSGGDLLDATEIDEEPGTGRSFEVNVDLFTSAFVTNNRSFEGHGADITDAVLVINENNDEEPADEGGVMGADCYADNEDIQCPQFGLLASNNNLRWNGVHFPVPGWNSDDNGGIIKAPIHPFQTLLRITSVRVNASMLGVPDDNAPAFTQVQADLVITGESAISVNNNQFNIGLPL